MDRRKFIKKSGLLIVGGAVAAGVESAAAAEGPEKWAMIIDLNRCTGCQACVIACKNQNKTAAGNFNTRVVDMEVGQYPVAHHVYTPIQCNQCDNPPCVKACPVGATFKLANGIVVTDWDKCQAKGECVESCPYGARSLDYQHGNKADKCDFCLDRLALGLEPACVELCPARARIFGDMNKPQGEFAVYLHKSGLKVRRAGLNTGPRIQYVPLRHAQGGVI